MPKVQYCVLPSRGGSAEKVSRGVKSDELWATFMQECQFYNVFEGVSAESVVLCASFFGGEGIRIFWGAQSGVLLAT